MLAAGLNDIETGAATGIVWGSGQVIGARVLRVESIDLRDVGEHAKEAERLNAAECIQEYLKRQSLDRWAAMQIKKKLVLKDEWADILQHSIPMELAEEQTR